MPSAAAFAAPIGILGGTFDPIHYGHLRLAQEMADSLALSCVRFIPAGDPYHRSETSTPAAHRLAMVQRALAGNALFRVDTREIERPGRTYTIDTLEALRAEVGDHVPLVVILGADAFALLHTWHRWRELPNFAHFAIAERPGATDWVQQLTPQLAAELCQRRVRDSARLRAANGGGIIIVPMTPLSISGTGIRQQIKQGHSPRYLLPEEVLNYINEHGLYQERTTCA